MRDINETHDALRDRIVALVEPHREALGELGAVSAILSAAVRIAMRSGRHDTLRKALRIAVEALEENAPRKHQPRKDH